MSTKIYSADITLGDSPNSIVLKNEAVRKLPLHILQSNAYFMAWIKSKVTKTELKHLLNKKTKMLTVNIAFKKQIGIVNQEPTID